MIVIPYIVDGSRLSALSYTTSCTCVCQLVGLTYPFKVIKTWCKMLESQVTNKQTGRDPLVLEPLDCNKETTNSDTLSVFLHLRSWLCVGMFCKRTIICVSYMRIHVLMSDYNGNESLDGACDIPTTIALKQLRSTGPLAPQFPYPFFPHTMSRNCSESIW